MMPNPSKTKGSAWELEIATHLSELYSEHFMRTPSSGAYVGGSNTNRKLIMHESQIRNFKGDIIPGPSFPNLNIEAKSYKDFPFHQLFTGKPCKQLELWLGQLLEAAEPKDFNLLIIKVSRKGKYIVSPIGTTNLSNLRYITYNSSRHGLWAFSNYDSFWATNKGEVQQFSCNCNS